MREKRDMEGKGKGRDELRKIDGWCLEWMSLRLEEGIPDRQALP